MTHRFVSFILTLSLGFTTALNAQEEDPSCLPPSKKVQKYLSAAAATQDPQTAVTNYNKAIDEAPESAAAYFEYAMYVYRSGEKYYNDFNQAYGDRSFKTAETVMEKAIALCSDYNSDMYYVLGIINYTQKEIDNSIAAFENFIAFKADDNSRYTEDFVDKQKDAKAVVAQFKEQQELLKNEVPFQPVTVMNVSQAESDENFPMISPDNELMFFTRKPLIASGSEEQTGFGESKRKIEVLSSSVRTSEQGEFSKGDAVGPPFDDPAFNNFGATTLSTDNKEMIICGCKFEDINGQRYNNCDLYMTTYERVGETANDYKWSPLVNLGPGINSRNGWEGQPSLSADGQTLYFAANRPTTKNNDVFVAKRNADGSWGEAVPFEPVNTENNDKGPFLHQDSETLYFVSSSSDTRKGVGGLDIFYIREENGQWSKPKNIGFPINSTEDELGLFVSIDGKLGYFSSKTQGNYNIFAFELYADARPKKVAMLKGELKDNEGNPVQGATIEIAYENNTKVEQVKVNGNDGKYAVIVKQEQPQDIMISVKKDGAAFDSKLITKEEIAVKENRFNNDLAVKELKVGEAYTINDILYPTTSAELSSRSKFILREFARYLKAHPGITIAIQGHTDDEGDDALNMDLSDRRAKGVRDYLISLGITANRLDAKGFGETQPKVPNDSAENKAKNRRTDFVIVGM